MLELQIEPFVGKYDGVTPPTMLRPGDLSGGKNVRKVSPLGGWKPRRGGVLHNTTALESGNDIDSLHYYENPKQTDIHFLAQVNNKLYDSTGDPPTVSGAGFGTDIGGSIGPSPGFSCIVDEWFVYADGANPPQIWGGDNPYVFGVMSYDNSTTTFIDITRKCTDGRSDVYGLCLGAASDKLYVITGEPCEGLKFTLDAGGLNTNVAAMTVKAWRAGAWAAVSSLVDGTESPAGDSMGASGTVTWTRSTSDTMRIVGGLIMGYAYEISWSAALSNTIYITALKSQQDMNDITNKWDGAYEWVTGCRFFDQSTGVYQELIGKVTSDATSLYADLSSATTSDYLYLKTPEPATAFHFSIPHDYPNTAAAVVDLIEYWDGDSWVTVGTLTDTTKDEADDSSLAHTGMIWFNAAAITPVMRMFEGDNQPGFWYRMSWDVALSANTRVFMVAYALLPESLPNYNGCLEFKNRLFLWGDPEWPNRLRFSAQNRPDCFSGTDSGYTDAIAGADKILCAVKFYNELLVYKQSSIWLLEGDDPFNFGYAEISSTVGLASRKSVQVAEVGTPGIHNDEPMSIAIHQDIDGVYVIDGRKPRKVSMPVDHYFNREYSTAIAVANIGYLQSFQDPSNNEYHLLLPTSELVYNYINDEWYPPWERGIDLICGLNVKVTDDAIYTYGGRTDGIVERLEADTVDKNGSNVDVAIEHSIKTRAIGAEPDKPPTMRFTLRRIWAEFKARTAGSPVTKTYVNQATSGTTQNKPSAMSMINTGFNVAIPKLEISEQNVDCFQVEFSLNTADQEMEIRNITYEREIRGVT